MFTRDEVVEMLSHLKDSESDKPIIVEGVSGKEEDKNINVKLAITQTTSAKKQEIEAQVIFSLKKKGAKSVNVLFTELPAQIKPQEETILNTKHPVKYLAIASGKGGVGKSTVTVNLAVALARLGKRVGIADCDIYGPSIPNMMGIAEKPLIQDEKIIPIVSNGVKVISMEFFKEDDSPVIWRGPMLGRMLDVFFTQVRWGQLDFLLLDLPPGTGDIAMDVSKRIPSCQEIIVTTPHSTASFIAKKAGKQAMQMDHPVIGVIENMSYLEINGEKQFVFGQGGGEILAKELDTDLLAQIPMGQPNPALGKAPSVYEEDHPIAKIYDEIAERLIR